MFTPKSSLSASLTCGLMKEEEQLVSHIPFSSINSVDIRVFIELIEQEVKNKSVFMFSSWHLFSVKIIKSDSIGQERLIIFLSLNSRIFSLVFSSPTTTTTSFFSRDLRVFSISSKS